MDYEHLISFSLACGFFSRLLCGEPAHDFLLQLKSDRLFSEWPLDVQTAGGERGLQLLTAFARDYTENCHKTVVREYTDLFIGPRDAIPLWESVWTSKDKLLFDAPVFAVREIYARHGITAALAGNEPEDHIGLELSFLAGLLGLAADAKRNDRLRAQELMDEAHAFLREHLERWAFDFLQACASRATTQLYRGAALLCEDTLMSVIELLEENDDENIVLLK